MSRITSSAALDWTAAKNLPKLAWTKQEKHWTRRLLNGDCSAKRAPWKNLRRRGELWEKREGGPRKGSALDRESRGCGEVLGSKIS